MALKWFKVVEFGGLAPGPFCGMILADHGAKVIRIDRPTTAPDHGFGRGKRSITINLKEKAGRKVAYDLCKTADVVIEPYRPGVMEKLGLGPKDLMKENPGLVYARLTGFGQSGQMAPRAGHDLNYLALSGILPILGRTKRPHWPINTLADFAGGGLMCALGISMALLERSKSGKGQVVDTAMVEGAAYVGSWFFTARDHFAFAYEKGKGILDGGAHFYEVYETKDGKFMSVGAIEPQFYSALLKVLGIAESDMPQFASEDWPKNKERLEEIFAHKTREEWCDLFDHVDACVAPVLNLEEASQHEHNRARKAFLESSPGQFDPAPAPKLSRTPGLNEILPQPKAGQHTVEILQEINYSQLQIEDMIEQGTIVQNLDESKL